MAMAGLGYTTAVSDSILSRVPKKVHTPEAKIDELLGPLNVPSGKAALITPPSKRDGRYVSPEVHNFLTALNAIRNLNTSDRPILNDFQNTIPPVNQNLSDYVLERNKTSSKNPKYEEYMKRLQINLEIPPSGVLDQLTIDTLRNRWNAAKIRLEPLAPSTGVAAVVPQPASKPRDDTFELEGLDLPDTFAADSVYLNRVVKKIDKLKSSGRSYEGMDDDRMLLQGNDEKALREHSDLAPLIVSYAQSVEKIVDRIGKAKRGETVLTQAEITERDSKLKTLDPSHVPKSVPKSKKSESWDLGGTTIEINVTTVDLNNALREREQWIANMRAENNSIKKTYTPGPNDLYNEAALKSAEGKLAEAKKQIGKDNAAAKTFLDAATTVIESQIRRQITFTRATTDDVLTVLSVLETKNKPKFDQVAKVKIEGDNIIGDATIGRANFILGRKKYEEALALAGPVSTPAIASTLPARLADIEQRLGDMRTAGYGSAKLDTIDTTRKNALAAIKTREFSKASALVLRAEEDIKAEIYAAYTAAKRSRDNSVAEIEKLNAKSGEAKAAHLLVEEGDAIGGKVMTNPKQPVYPNVNYFEAKKKYEEAWNTATGNAPLVAISRKTVSDTEVAPAGEAVAPGEVPGLVPLVGLAQTTFKPVYSRAKGEPLTCTLNVLETGVYVPFSKSTVGRQVNAEFYWMQVAQVNGSYHIVNPTPSARKETPYVGILDTSNGQITDMSGKKVIATLKPGTPTLSDDDLKSNYILGQLCARTDNSVFKADYSKTDMIIPQLRVEKIPEKTD